MGESLEKHYEEKLKRTLKEYCKLVMEEKELSPIWKMNHLNTIGDMLKVIEKNSREER